MLGFGTLAQRISGISSNEKGKFKRDAYANLFHQFSNIINHNATSLDGLNEMFNDLNSLHKFSPDKEVQLMRLQRTMEMFYIKSISCNNTNYMSILDNEYNTNDALHSLNPRNKAQGLEIYRTLRVLGLSSEIIQALVQNDQRRLIGREFHTAQGWFEYILNPENIEVGEYPEAQNAFIQEFLS